MASFYNFDIENDSRFLLGYPNYIGYEINTIGDQYMRSRIFYFFMLSIPFLMMVGCSSSKSTEQTSLSQTAVWQKQPLVIDGSDSDWIKPLTFFDKKEKLNYAVSNDKENIYLMLSTRDPLEQQKILQGGLTVWINTQAQKNETSALGIAFPTDSRNNHDRSIMAAARPDLYRDKINSLADIKDYSLYGFKSGDTVENYDLEQNNDEGIALSLNYNQAGDLVYEAMIPLNAIFPKNNSHNYAGKTLAVGLFIEGIPPSPGSRRSGGGSPVSIGGGLGFGSFGGGGGMGLSIGTGSFGRGGSRSDRQLYEPNHLWQVLDLARPH
jgi:hypothetical protein